MKTCSKCKVEQPLSAFPKSGGGGKISSWCRGCHHARYAEKKAAARKGEMVSAGGFDPMQQIADAMKLQDVTIKALADAVGVSAVNARLWFVGKSKPRQKTLQAAFDFLGLEIPLSLKTSKDGRMPLAVKNCDGCGIEFPVYKVGVRFCSRECAGKDLSQRQLGAANARWRGGETVTRHIGGGYVKELRPDHPARDASGYVMQHRLVMEQVLGCPLRPTERVHHKNGDRQDNRPENLELWTGVGTSKKDPHGVRIVDKVLDLIDRLTPVERARVAAKLKEME